MSAPLSMSTESASAAKTQFIRQHPQCQFNSLPQRTDWKELDISNGYDGRIDGIHSAELADRLKGAVYLDHGGCGLYTASHLSSTHAYLSQSLLLNPHSDPSTSTIIDQIRESVLSYLGTDSKQHSVIFSYNTSTAMNLLGSIFPFRAHSEVALTMDNHNSALGMREKVKACNARFSVVTPATANNTKDAAKVMQCCCSANLLSQHTTPPPTDAFKTGVNPCLFIFPAESNFDGRMYDLRLAEIAHSYNSPLSSESSASTSTASSTCSVNPLGFHNVGPAFRWYTFVDASKYLITSPLNLSQNPHVDFATVSFYKMFGFPTGLAALIIKNSTAQALWGVPYSHSPASVAAELASKPSLSSLSSLRSYFSGGTLNAAIADEDFHVSKSTGKLHDLLEDGTIAFTTIISLPYGIQLFKTLNPNNIHAHTSALCDYLFEWLQQQRYPSTRQPLCIFYGDRASKSSAALRFGATLNLNFLDQHGQVIGYKTVEKIAISNRIFIRSGSFCNPGACQQSYPISADQIRRNLLSGYACWEDGENLNGVINGSVRISMGWCTRFEDVYKFQQFVLGEIMNIGQQTFISNLTADTQKPNRSDTSLSGTIALPPEPSPFPTLPSHFLTPSTPLTESVVSSSSSFSLTPIVSSNSAFSPPSLASAELPDTPFLLSQLTIYPVKSCAGVSVSKWFVSSQGSTLFLDREFVLLDAYGVALSQKVLPSLQLIRPSIDLANKSMTLRAPNHSPISVSLTDAPSADSGSGSNASLCSMQVCGNAAVGYVYDTPNHVHITEWLTSVVGKYTCLARKSTSISWPMGEYLKQMQLNGAQSSDASADSDSSTLPSPSASSPSSTNQRNSFSSTVESSAPTPAASATSGPTRSSFANEDDFLLVNAASVREVETRLHEYVANHKLLTPHPNDAHISPSRFRPNFVIDSCRGTLAAFAEDTWKHVFIGPFSFRVKGGCGRCVMVNVQPQTGERNSSLYALLNTCRKKDGRVLFGSLLSNITHENEDESNVSEEWWPIAIGMGCSASTE